MYTWLTVAISYTCIYSSSTKHDIRDNDENVCMCFAVFMVQSTTGQPSTAARKGIRSVATYRARRDRMARCYSRRDKMSVRQLPWQRGWGWGGGLLTTCSMTTCRRAPLTHAYLQHVLGRRAQYISTSAVYLTRITACWCFMCLDGPKQ